MSGPLSLRLCCLAAMAPALTEATAQSTRMKLPGSPTQSSNTPVLNGRDQLQGVRSNGASSRSLLNKVTRISTRPQSHIPSRLHVNGNGTLGVKTSAVSANHPPCKKFVQNRGVTESRSLLQITSTNGRTRTSLGGRMNQTAPPIESKPGKDLSVRPATASTSHTHQSLTFVNGKGGLNQERESKPRISNAMGHKGLNTVMASELSSVRGLKERCGDCFGAQTIQTGTDQSDCDEASIFQETKNCLCELEKRKRSLMRRLRRLQGRHVVQHISQQLSQYVDFQQKNLQTVAKSARGSSDSANPTGSSDLKTDLFQTDRVKNLSTAALVNLVQTLQANNSLNSQRTASSAKPETASVLTMDGSVRKESQLTSQHLLHCLHHSRCAVDSDATESSSGGESCDEEELAVPKDKKFQHAPLHRRAEWKWFKERAAVVAKWTWLQAQVSDLEYRIRQQGDIHKQIRSNKGAIVLEDSTELGSPRLAVRTSRLGPSGVDSQGEVTASSSQASINTMITNVSKQVSLVSQSLGNCISPASNNLKAVTPSPTRALNGVIDSPASSASEVGHSESVGGGGGLDSPSVGSVTDSPDSSSCRAARCLAVGAYKKRKLLRTAGLHLTHRKAARLSTVKCHCYPPVTPCSMCGGRYNNTFTVDPDVMPLHERVAILDPSFHPVLSFPQDIPLAVQFEAMLKSGEWQNRPPPRRPRSESDKRRQRMAQISSDSSRKVARAIRKNVTAAYLQSQKIRNKYENKGGRKPGGSGRGGSSNQQLSRRRALMAVKRQSNKLLSLSLSTAGSRSATPLPSPGGTLSASCPGSAFKDLRDAPIRRRRGESTFDINNIVIPYSIASTAKVEQLNYKPIVTPKWRDLTVEGGNDDEDSRLTSAAPAVELETENVLAMEEDQSEDEEDISDLAYQRRHQKCEEEEKSRFMPQVHSTARRGRVRMESSLQTQDSASQDGRHLADMDIMPSTPEALASPAVLSPTPVSPALTSPTPVSSALTSPVPVSALAHPVSVSSALTSPLPASAALSSPAPVSPALASPAPVSSTLASPAPVSSALVSPAPMSAAASPVPMSSTLASPAPVSSAVASPAPTSSALASSLLSMPTSPMARPGTPTGAQDDSSQDRRRSFSLSRRDRLSSSLQSLEGLQDGPQELEEPGIEPWPLRSFPLEEEVYEGMRREQPPLVEVPRSVESSAPPEFRSDSTPSSSHPCSPLPSSASNSMVGDDPNDPEWTGTSSEKMPRKVAGSKR